MFAPEESLNKPETRFILLKRGLVSFSRADRTSRPASGHRDCSNDLKFRPDDERMHEPVLRIIGSGRYAPPFDCTWKSGQRSVMASSDNQTVSALATLHARAGPRHFGKLSGIPNPRSVCSLVVPDSAELTHWRGSPGPRRNQA